MHRHLSERICTLENLIAAAKSALRGRRMRQPGSDLLADFEKEVVSLHDQLSDAIYRHGGCHYFTIYEAKERVAATPFRDRVVHHAIVRVIEPIFERRYKRLLWDLRHRGTPVARVTQSVCAWGGGTRPASAEFRTSPRPSSSTRAARMRTRGFS